METALVQATNDDAAIALWLHGKGLHSQRAYRRDARQFTTFLGHTQLGSVTLGNLQQFADSLEGRAAASRKRTLASIKSLLTFCQRIGYLRFNVGAGLVVRGGKNRLAERILPREDVIRMIALESNPRNHALLQFLYDSGCRAEELCRLTWCDVQSRQDGCAQVTVFGKGSRTRFLMIGPTTYGELLTLRDPNGDDHAPLFPSRSGRPLDQPQVFRIVRTAAVRADITANVSPHWFRHACASHALDAGAPISLVQQQLGHSSLEITGAYLHARPNDGLFRYLA
jgi:integrase/recombinase XerD